MAEAAPIAVVPHMLPSSLNAFLTVNPAPVSYCPCVSSGPEHQVVDADPLLPANRWVTDGTRTRHLRSHNPSRSLRSVLVAVSAGDRMIQGRIAGNARK